MGCHPSHWRTPSFFRGVGLKPPTRFWWFISIFPLKVGHFGARFSTVLVTSGSAGTATWHRAPGRLHLCAGCVAFAGAEFGGILGFDAWDLYGTLGGIQFEWNWWDFKRIWKGFEWDFNGIGRFEWEFIMGCISAKSLHEQTGGNKRSLGRLKATRGPDGLGRIAKTSLFTGSIRLSQGWDGPILWFFTENRLGRHPKICPSAFLLHQVPVLSVDFDAMRDQDLDRQKWLGILMGLSGILMGTW